MKKVLGLFILVMSLTVQSFSQSDDGFVTSHLNIAVNDTAINSIVNGFDGGFTRVESGELKTVEEVNSAYRLNIMVTSSINPGISSSVNFSPAFINTLNSEIQKVGNEFTSVNQLRNSFVDMANSGILTADDSKALALIDILFQKMIQKYPTAGFSYNGSVNSNMVSGPSASFENNFLYNANDNIRLPAWARCALGTIGSAIMGGLGGMAAGAQVGAHVGAAIGGVVGVIGGVFTGVATFCWISPGFSKLTLTS